MRKLVFDLDDILAGVDGRDGPGHYERLSARMAEYRELGFEIVLTSSASAPDGQPHQPGAAAATTALFRRIEELGLVYDAIWLAKPSAGPFGLILDDKAITPEEFLTRNFQQISRLLNQMSD